MSRPESFIWAALLAVSLTICLATWTFALWYTGARFTYRPGLIALYLAPEAGVSLQLIE